MACATDHLVEAPDGVNVTICLRGPAGLGAGDVHRGARPGQTLRVVKFISYGWSSLRSTPALRDQAPAALTGAMLTGWEGLLRDQRGSSTSSGQGADVEVDGDPELQQAVRFALFHVLQAASGRRSARSPPRASPARLRRALLLGHRDVRAAGARPHLAARGRRRPALAAPHLRRPRERARQLGLPGAAFPWRTINGEECSGYWPAGTAAFHINADIADAVIRYHDAVRDEEFDATVGLELLVETARLWRRPRPLRPGRGVRGSTASPARTSTARSRTTTCTRCSWRSGTCGAAAIAATQRPAAAAALGVDRRPRSRPGGSAPRRSTCPTTTVLRRPRAVRRLHRPRPVGLRTDSRGPATRCCSHHPYFDLYRRQVCKQADLVLAMQLRGDAFTPEQKAAQLRLLRGVHRAGLVAVRLHPGGARRRGRLPRPGLRLRVPRPRSWTCTTSSTTPVTGCTSPRSPGPGRRSSPGSAGCATTTACSSSPRGCPTRLTRLRPSRIRHRGGRLRVETDGANVTYDVVDDGHSVEILHHGKPLTLHSGESVRVPVPPLPVPPPQVRQPVGREPVRRWPA